MSVRVHTFINDCATVLAWGGIGVVSNRIVPKSDGWPRLGVNPTPSVHNIITYTISQPGDADYESSIVRFVTPRFDAPQANAITGPNPLVADFRRKECLPYCHIAEIDTVFGRAVRRQREAGYTSA